MRNNKTKNLSPINHHSCPVPINFRAEALMKEKHLAGIIKACINVYKQCPNAKDRVKHVEEILQAREGEGDAPEEQEPVSVDQQTDILLECFGEQRGTKVRGMGGAGERHEKKRVIRGLHGLSRGIGSWRKQSAKPQKRMNELHWRRQCPWPRCNRCNCRSRSSLRREGRRPRRLP